MSEGGVVIDIWRWLVSTGPAAGATWVGTVLSAVGLAISIIGLTATYREAKAAKKQASAAVVAVERLKSSLGSSSLAYVHSQIGLLIQFVDGSHFYPAHVLLATLGREIFHHSGDIDLSENSKSDLKRRLHIAEVQIGYAQDFPGKYKAAVLRKTLASLQRTISDWENSLRRQATEVSK